MTSEIKLLGDLKLALDKSIDAEEVDLRTIYQLKGHQRLFDEALQKEFSNVIEMINTNLVEHDGFSAISNVERLSGLLEARITEALLFAENAKEEMGNDSAYFEITQAERDAITMLAADMRKIVSTSVQFDKPHRVRLLKRISAIEQEVHKEKGLFDVILGGISDVGETAGQFGEDVKPLVERMAEIEQITRGKSPDYAQLEKPEEVLKIEDKTDEGDDD